MVESLHLLMTNWNATFYCYMNICIYLFLNVIIFKFHIHWRKFSTPLFSVKKLYGFQ